MKNKTNMQNKKGVGLRPFGAPLRSGFTLIELLVVVLIIGILAAVALPQYKKAVEKSRAAEAWSVLKTLNEAREAYTLEHQTKPTSLADMDITIPDNANFTYGIWGSGNWAGCGSFDDGTGHAIGEDDYTIYASHKVGPSYTLFTCGSTRYCQNSKKVCEQIGFKNNSPYECMSKGQPCFVE